MSLNEDMLKIVKVLRQDVTEAVYYDWNSLAIRLTLAVKEERLKETSGEEGGEA